MKDLAQEEVQQLWMDALTNGEYEQTIRRLHAIENIDGEEVHKFCVIGVLCYLYQKHVGGLHEVRLDKYLGTTGFGLVQYNGHGSLIPTSVKEWAGLKISDEPCGSILMDANDEGKTFSELVETIKDNRDELFAE